MFAISHHLHNHVKLHPEKFHVLFKMLQEHAIFGVKDFLMLDAGWEEMYLMCEKDRIERKFTKENQSK